MSNVIQSRLRALTCTATLLAVGCGGAPPAASVMVIPRPAPAAAPVRIPLAPATVAPPPSRGRYQSDVQFGDAVTSVPIAGVQRSIARLRAKFRACHGAALENDPHAAGRAHLHAEVAADGEVSSASAIFEDGLPPAVATCAARALSNAFFDAPDGGASSELSFVVTFAPLNADRMSK